MSALIRAARNGHLGVVKLLVEQDADVHQVDRYGNSALISAIMYGHYDIAKYLIRDAADCLQEVKGQTVIEILVDADPQNITLFHEFEIPFTERMLSEQCQPLTRQLIIYRPSHPNEKIPSQTSSLSRLSQCFEQRKLYPHCPQKPMDMLMRALILPRLVAIPAASRISCNYWQLGQTAMDDLLMLKTYFTSKLPNDKLPEDMVTVILSFLVHPGFIERNEYPIARCLQKPWSRVTATTDTESAPQLPAQ